MVETAEAAVSSGGTEGSNVHLGVVTGGRTGGIESITFVWLLPFRGEGC